MDRREYTILFMFALIIKLFIQSFLIMSEHTKIDNSPYCTDTFFIKSVGKFYAIKISEINWIYAKGHHCNLNMEDGNEINIRMSLSSIIEYLDTNIFVQSHRNYIINYCKIEIYDPAGIVLINQSSIPVSKKYKKEVESKLSFLT